MAALAPLEGPNARISAERAFGEARVQILRVLALAELAAAVENPLSLVEGTES